MFRIAVQHEQKAAGDRKARKGTLLAAPSWVQEGGGRPSQEHGADLNHGQSRAAAPAGLGGQHLPGLPAVASLSAGISLLLSLMTSSSALLPRDCF